MGFETIDKARKAQADEAKRIREIADEQQRKAGYSRVPGFAPAPRARNPYQPEADRPKVSEPLPPSKPLVADDSVKPRTTRRSFGVGEGDQ